MTRSTTLAEKFAALAAAEPDAPAITSAGSTVTRRKLEDRTNRLARAYQQLGVTPNSFVTLGLPNTVEFLEAAIAAWKCGATPQPVSYRLPARERQAIIELAEPSLEQERIEAFVSKKIHSGEPRWGNYPPGEDTIAEDKASLAGENDG